MSDSIPRFDPADQYSNPYDPEGSRYAGMEPDPHGDYVLHTDHVAALDAAIQRAVALDVALTDCEALRAAAEALCEALRSKFPWHRGDVGLPDVPVLQARYDALQKDAARWRALFVDGGRVRLLGSAGLGDATRKNKHIGVELSSGSAVNDDSDGRAALTQYADEVSATQRLQEAP